MTEQHKCCATVGRGFGFYACNKTAKYEHLGKRYCKTHHPPTVWEEAARRAALYPELLEALKDWVWQGPRRHRESGGEMKLTPWFPADVKPAYPGVYEVQNELMTWYRRWDGKRWCLGSRYPDCAANNGGMSMKELPWRGLAEPPKGWTK